MKYKRKAIYINYIMIKMLGYMIEEEKEKFEIISKYFKDVLKMILNFINETSSNENSYLKMYSMKILSFFFFF
jgi:hypothetical protein